MTRDFFKTPRVIVERMLEAVRLSEPRTIADFAVGEGDLLRPAEQRWPKASIVGTDISQRAIGDLRRSGVNWQMGCVDFLNERSSRASAVLRRYQRGVDLVLLNPPFSCRGGSKLASQFRDKSLHSSRALAFVIRSEPYLTKGGELIAVVPSGALESQRDRAAWAVLEANFDLSLVQTNGKRAFSPATANSVLVHLRKRDHCIPTVGRNRSEDLVAEKTYDRFVVRGTLSVHRAGLVGQVDTDTKMRTFVHSTHLVGGGVFSEVFVNRNEGRSVSGPAVLLPRVGTPDLSKISVLGCGSEVVLSDCVFGISCASHSQAKSLVSGIKEDWCRFAALYMGTCARHLTRARLVDYLLIWRATDLEHV